MPAEWLALSDDLTGGLEVGAKFASRGFETAVIPLAQFPAGPTHATARVLVICTETRHVPPLEAMKIVAGLAAAARAAGIRHLFKKTDSAMRGNIGAELEAIAGVFPGEPILFAPAYPHFGRTVKDACLFVDGIPLHGTPFARDPLNPAVSCHIPALLAATGWDLPLLAFREFPGSPLPGSALLLLDAWSEDDSRSAAAAYFASGKLRIAAGPAGFAGHLADCFAGVSAGIAPGPRLQSCLVVNGSLHEISCDQVEVARNEGWPICDPTDAAHKLRSGQWVILRNRAKKSPGGLEWARETGETVCTILREASIDGVAVFGGDTAQGILRAMGSPPLYPIREVIPGIPLSRISRPGVQNFPGGERKDIFLISKAGSFGDPDALIRVRRMLTANVRAEEID